MALAIAAMFAFALAACQGVAGQGDKPGDADWPLSGGTLMAQRFSPLESIDMANVERLGLAWSLDLDTEAGQEATPIMRDGVLYIVSAYSIVQAVEARTGKSLWIFDPGVRAAAAHSCCGPVSRGVAVEDGLVYLGALDGRLIALDAATGEVAWEVQTLDLDYLPAENYSITGVPRVVKGRVIIGNGGAEFGARGYITAYDARTGAKDWRFFFVPGKPGVRDNAASDEILAQAASTWHGRWWELGGGGTAWDAIEYDPELDLLYVGTGNGSPTNHGLRSEGRGDNLFLSSIVALRPETGEYVWHYQQTPGEAWDYTATQPIILADLQIEGRQRKVLMQAPKNGFFYVLDRATGELLSADPFAQTTWASGVDLATGRPIENPEARYYLTGRTAIVYPSSGGAHNWQPMAYSPQTGLVYIPVQEFGMPFTADPGQRVIDGVYNTGTEMIGGAALKQADLEEARAGLKGYLVAWDPVARRAVWKQEMATNLNGGLLATAGGLVFGGTGDKTFAAYDASTGEQLWSFPSQTGIVAAPISYALDGEQYIAIMAGWGGAWPMLGGQFAELPYNGVGPNRLLVFKLGGTASLPDAAPAARVEAELPPQDAASATIAEGDALYGRFCLRCHGGAAVSASMVPDLRYSAFLADDGFNAVVLGGAFASQGMPGFEGKLTQREVDTIRAYIIHRAREDRGR